MPEIPALLKERLNSQYGPELASRIAAGYVRKPVTFRVNTLKASAEKIAEQLRMAGIAFEQPTWYPDAFLLRENTEEDLRALPCYEVGEVYLQSLSSMLPALVLFPNAGETVLDMAAAPGGKTTQMAALSGGKALITACEKNPIRADRLQFNLDRQGAGRVSVMRQDARQLDAMFKFDKVLLDAPCSGSGTLILSSGEPQRRLTPDWLAKTVKTQTALLKKALSFLPKGHEMVYSTCSILREENEGVLKAVLPGAGAEVVPIQADFMTCVPLLPVELKGVCCVAPDALFEGFFVAKIRKK